MENDALLGLVLGVDVRHFVPLIVEEIQIDDNPVEHADAWHRRSLSAKLHSSKVKAGGNGYG